MPQISRFYGISIYLYYRDHPPPHFHAIYGEHETIVEIVTGQIVMGALPRRAQNLVAEWALLHRQALQDDWDLARASQALLPIPPLP